MMPAEVEPGRGGHYGHEVPSSQDPKGLLAAFMQGKATVKADVSAVVREGTWAGVGGGQGPFSALCTLRTWKWAPPGRGEGRHLLGERTA